MFELSSIGLRRVFLIDGVGALGSAVYNGVLLAGYSALLGIEKNLLLTLGAIALIYVAFSFFSFFSAMRLGAKTKRRLLLIIVGANLAYALVTSALTVFLPQISTYGRLGLAAEIFAIFLVVVLEWTVLNKTKDS